PLKFARPLGSTQTTPGTAGTSSQIAEMVGLTWESNPFRVALIKPDGTVLDSQSDSRNIKHVTGSNYDYYFLRNQAGGYWTVQISPINPAASGEGFSLITGTVGGVASSTP
ncbi:MAG: hypothetical protein LUQ63_04325, partial [Methanothrix sp.]|nr:hypothetical protein [Methanothrix sp.]